MEYLLVEDECAIDSRYYFEKELEEKYGFTIKDFTEKGVRTQKDDWVSYKYEGYVLEIFAEEQYWHFGKKQRYEKTI